MNVGVVHCIKSGSRMPSCTFLGHRIRSLQAEQAGNIPKDTYAVDTPGSGVRLGNKVWMTGLLQYEATFHANFELEIRVFLLFSMIGRWRTLRRRTYAGEWHKNRNKSG